MVTTVRKMLMIAVCTLLIFSGAGAQQTDEPTLPSADASAESEQLVRVVTLNTAQANNDFTRNVKIMQERRRAIVNLIALLEKEDDENDKYNIEAEIQDLKIALDDDHKLMAEAYRYSLNRRYVRSIEKATVYIQLTDEETSASREEYARKGIPAPKSLKSNMLSVCTLNNAETAQAFQQDVAKIRAQRDMAIQMKTAVDAAKSPEDKQFAKGRLDQVLLQITALNKAMSRTYGFSISRDYVLQIDKSALYIWALPSEITVASEVN